MYKDDKNICIKEYAKSFLASFFLNEDNFINIVHSLLKFCMGIFDMMMEGKLSQIVYFGPGSHFI